MSSKSLIVTVGAAILQTLINLGIGIYSAVILANNSKDLVPTEIYGFVMTICILNFVMSPVNLCSAFQEKNKSTSLSNTVGLGLFIWSCVILFGQNGMEYKSTNPYYMVVFVYFLISVILTGIIIVALPFICCCMCYKLSKEESAHPTLPVTTLPVTNHSPEKLTSIVIG